MCILTLGHARCAANLINVGIFRRILVAEYALLGCQLKLHTERDLRLLQNDTQEFFGPRKCKIDFPAAICRLHGVRRNEHEKQGTFVQMLRNILRPLHAGFYTLVIPDAVTEGGQLFNCTVNFSTVFMCVAHKNIRLGTVICRNHFISS